MIRIVLPRPLRTLAGVTGDVELLIACAPTQRLVIDALEFAYPALRGTIRDPATARWRPFIRFFACEVDLSHESPDSLLPQAVAAGAEPLHVVGAMTGG